MTGLIDRLIDRMEAAELTVQPKLPDQFSASPPWQAEQMIEAPSADQAGSISHFARPEPQPEQTPRKNKQPEITETQEPVKRATGKSASTVNTSPVIVRREDTDQPAPPAAPLQNRSNQVPHVDAAGQIDNSARPSAQSIVPTMHDVSQPQPATDAKVEHHTHLTQQTVDNLTVVQQSVTTSPQPDNPVMNPAVAPQQPLPLEQKAKSRQPAQVPAPQSVNLPYAPVTSAVQPTVATDVAPIEIDPLQTQPSVSVTIETVEINAATPVKSVSKKSTVRARQPTMTLDAYLSSRERSR